MTATGGTLTFPTFPTYKLNLRYNDANQVISAQTSSNPGTLGYTAAPVYDSTTGVEIGLSTNVSTTPSVASLAYNAQALISSINFLANSTTTVATESFQYDGDLRVNSANACWQTACTTPPACPTAAFFCQGLTYDAASNVINLSTTQAAIPGITNSGGSETQVFCYDEQNRLTWAGNNTTPPTSCSGNGTPANTFFGASYHAAYSFNNLGQITTGPYNGTGTTQLDLYCDSTHPHALTIVAATGSTCTSQTGTNYTASYDARGNMTSRATKSGTSLDTQTLSFDGLDHLVRWNDTVTVSNEEWYMYDASGNRVLQRSTTGSGSSNTTITVYAFGLEEHAYNGAGTLNGSKYYYSLGGRMIGKTSGSGAPTFFLTDMLGSVLADFSGASGTSAVSGNQTYGPYGNLQYFKGSMGTVKGFTGQYQDDLSGLDSFGARSYDHLGGTFLSADTVQGNLQGDDPYAYVGGNPETFSDPTGRSYKPGQPGGGIATLDPGAETGSGSDTSSNTSNAGDGGNLSGSSSTSSAADGLSWSVTSGNTVTQYSIDPNTGDTIYWVYKGGFLVAGGDIPDTGGSPKAVNGAVLAALGIKFHFPNSVPGGFSVNVAPQPMPPTPQAGSGSSGSGGRSPGKPTSPPPGPNNPNSSGGIFTVRLSRSLHPETCGHIEDAINNGQPSVLTKDTDPVRKSLRRRAALNGYPTILNLDRDEYPMAMTLEGGSGADIRYINPSDNRGAGSSIRSQLDPYPDGTQFTIECI